MQRDEVPLVKAKQHARRPFRWEISPHLPQTVSQRSAERHPHGSTPLRAQQVFSYGVALGFWQSPQPIPYWLATWPQAVKNQRDFSRLPVFCHIAPYMVLLYLTMYNRGTSLALTTRPCEEFPLAL
jgi:hypothetical protein